MIAGHTKFIVDQLFAKIAVTTNQMCLTVKLALVIGKHAEVFTTLQVMEDDLVADQELQRAFCFGCCAVGVYSESISKAHQLLLRHMVHTHGNELVESKLCWMV